jgi:hypothetical protein
MPLRGKNRMPPYEVMGRQGPGAGSGQLEGAKAPPQREQRAEAAPDQQQERSSQATGGSSQWIESAQQLWQRFRGWVRGTGPPLTLRLPRGMAAVAVASGLLVLVLAWFTGYSQGVDAGQAMVRGEQRARSSQAAAQQRTPNGMAGMAPGQDGAADRAGQNLFGTDRKAGSAPVNGEPRSRGESAASGEPRQAGKNYFVLATWPELSARQLAGFFRDRGVAITLEKSDDGRFRVIVAARGFDSINSQAYDQYRRRLIDLVRDWNSEAPRGQRVNTDLSAALYQSG